VIYFSINNVFLSFIHGDDDGPPRQRDTTPFVKPKGSASFSFFVQVILSPIYI